MPNSLWDTLQGNSDENQLNLSCLSAAHFFNPPSIKIRHPVPIYRLMHWKIRSFSGQLQAALTPNLGTTVLIHTARRPCPQVIAQMTMAIVTAALPLTFQRDAIGSKRKAQQASWRHARSSRRPAAISSREWRNAKKRRIEPLRLPVPDFAAEKDGR